MQKPASIDPFTAAEYAIGFESLRFVTQLEAAKAGSAAALARELDLPARRLRQFLAGADPAPEVWVALTEHVRRMDGAKPRAPVGVLGFAVTVAALPTHQRKEARVRLAYALIELHAERGERVPSWLPAVLDLWEGR
jgi:hypothetical protein